MQSIAKLFLLLSYLLFSSSALATFKIEQIANGLVIPWAMAFVNPQQIIITERAGRIRLLDLSNNKLTSVNGAPRVASGGQGGLLDVAIAPDYSTSRWIYFTYSKPSKLGAVTTLARAKLQDQTLTDWQDLLVSDSASDTSRHFGSRIAFDIDDHVFFGIGDRGERSNGQNLNNHAGSILRLNLDGSVPADNPFVGQNNKRDEIWSFGHRNPQGLAFDPKLNALWEIEHGPRGGDEINLIRKGRNYGWPITSHGKEYWAPLSVGEGTEKAGIESPLLTYIPSIAPASLMLYSGAAFPQWNYNLFAGALKLQHLNRVAIRTGNRLEEQQRLLEDLNERVRSVVQGPLGLIYFATDNGKIYRMVPN